MGGQRLLVEKDVTVIVRTVKEFCGLGQLATIDEVPAEAMEGHFMGWV